LTSVCPSTHQQGAFRRFANAQRDYMGRRKDGKGDLPDVFSAGWTSPENFRRSSVLRVKRQAGFSGPSTSPVLLRRSIRRPLLGGGGERRLSIRRISLIDAPD